MKLTVNGVVVRVIDRIEIVLDVAEDGDTLLNGAEIHIQGGPLTILAGNSKAPFFLRHDSPLTLKGNKSVAVQHNDDSISCNREPLGGYPITPIPGKTR